MDASVPQGRNGETWVVTGGAGFIGSHLVEELCARGERVLVIDDLSAGRIENLPQSPLVRVLKKNVLDVTPADVPERIRGIAHLAATPSVTTSWDRLLACHQNNLTTVLHVLDLATQRSIPRLVFSSSAAVYGAQTVMPVREDAPLGPQSPYGAQKLMGEEYLSLFCRERRLSAFSLRFFNVYGARQDPTSPYSGVISVFRDRMRQGKDLTIFGDGLQTRDFIAVKDVARAVSLALRTPAAPGEHHRMNIGTAVGRTLLELVDALRLQFPHWQGKVHHAPERTGDIRHSVADVSRATAKLGFKTEVNFADGLRF